jgi:photosystem II stability/assembly factor-like uncharacterized protein
MLAAGPHLAAAESRTASGYPSELMHGLEYRLVGPFRGGRSTAVAGVPGDPRTFYMGTTGGGVWKTTDGGLTWRNVSDKVREEKPQAPPRAMGEVAPEPPAPTKRARPGDEFGSASVGAIAVAPSDPNVVYVGMGSACIRGNVSPGDGVYRTTDGGESWRHLGLERSGQIGRIAIDPRNADHVYVAVLGHAFGPNSERGVYRSRDGGRSWEKVLFVSERAGAVDLALDPGNPRVLYAATWEAVRRPWEAISGGAGSGLYKSTDGGDTWRELTEGLPEGIKGRIGVAVSPARTDRVWALVEHGERWGLYRSDDGGKRFRLVSSDRNLITRAWYYTHVVADPRDPATVWVLNVGLWRSEDGGKTFTPLRTPHGDHHDLWIHPDHPEIMIEADDGGASVTTNGGRTWTTQGNQPTAEMYRVAVDDRFPYWLYGGQQDNSTVAIPSRVPGTGIAREDWYTPGGCESGHVAVDPRNPDVTYAGCYGGTIGRYDRRTGHETEVMAYPQLAVGQQAADLRYRFQWNAPIRISPHDPRVIYHTSQYVHRSRDEGRSWELISPDLTHDRAGQQGSSGGPITRDNTGVEVFGTIFAFEESPQVAGLLWAGSDDGRVHVSRDAGATWRDVTPRQLPENGTVNAIELSPHDPERVFLAVHRYRLDDFRPFIFRTDDGGGSWKLLTDGSNGIPADTFVRVVREDPDRRGLLYAGTEFGIYASFDDGKRWQPLQLDLPVTPITDLAVKRQDLVVATQGRSYWILDDLTPLHQLNAELTEAKAHLFAPRAAYQVLGAGGSGGPEAAVGRNPAYGAWIFYHLGEDLEGEGKTEVKIEILDAAGDVLRTRSSQKEESAAPSMFARFFPELVEPRKLDARKGLNRYVWNLRLADAEIQEDAVLWGSARGPEVAPGDYRVRLTVGEWSAEQPLAIRNDPRDAARDEELRERYELARQVWQALSDSHRLLGAVRDLEKQVSDLGKRVAADEPDTSVEERGRAVVQALTAIEDRLHQGKAQASQDILNFPPQLDNQLIFLLEVVGSARGRPTLGSYERFAELRAQLAELRRDYERAVGEELAAYRDLLREREVPAIIVPRLETE